MAITVAALNTALDSQDTRRKAYAVKHVSSDTATTDAWYVIGGVGVSKKSRWCQTTRANTAAQQAAQVVASMT